MKVYVVKNDKSEYMTETGDFIKSLWQAEWFDDYETANCYAPSGCNIVECSLMEKYQLADYTKQVRKEVCNEIIKFVDSNSKYTQEYGDIIYSMSLIRELDKLMGKKEPSQAQGE